MVAGLKDSMDSEDLGFTSFKSDAGIFIVRTKLGFVIAVIYVDDALFCGPNKNLVNRFNLNNVGTRVVRLSPNVTYSP